MIDYREEANAICEELVTQRRDFHQHPELRFQEHRTSQIIAKQLNQLGLEVQTGIAQTGVVGILEGDKPGTTVLYRSDMDALPIQEDNDEIDYCSTIPGVMHACGHDGHMAIALGIAKIMSKHRDKINGRIKFVFQPAEEGAGGAEAMIDEGILENPEPDVALGMHLWNPLPVGHVGVASGATMSGSSTFKIVVHGKGGHAAMPHTTVDPVACSGHLITALHTIVSRKMDAMAGAVVLSVTGVKTSSHEHNIIPETVEIVGTFRTFNAYTSEVMEQHIRDVSFSVCESVGCKSMVTVRHLTIPVVNDEAVVERVKTAFSHIVEPEKFEDARTMASEDVAYLMEDVPGMYVFVGASNPAKGLTYGHHHPKFNFDEDALPLAVALMSSAIGQYVCTPPAD